MGVIWAMNPTRRDSQLCISNNLVKTKYFSHPHLFLVLILRYFTFSYAGLSLSVETLLLSKFNFSDENTPYLLLSLHSKLSIHTMKVKNSGGRRERCLTKKGEAVSRERIFSTIFLTSASPREKINKDCFEQDGHRVAFSTIIFNSSNLGCVSRSSWRRIKFFRPKWVKAKLPASPVFSLRMAPLSSVFCSWLRKI